MNTVHSWWNTLRFGVGLILLCAFMAGLVAGPVFLLVWVGAPPFVAALGGIAWLILLCLGGYLLFNDSAEELFDDTSEQ